MKIECDKCGAKYSIADDKVRGKTFKIRCKKCSNVIIVRDKAGGGDAAESEAPADEPGWHLAIGGETVGPLSESEVRERFAAGEIDRETSVWQEGFEDWLPLGDVGTFSDLAAGGAAGGADGGGAADPFAGAGEDDYSSPSGGGYSSPEPARAAPVAAAPVAAATPAAAAPVAAKGEASPRVSQLTSTRNENSVLFSLDSLSSMAMGSGSKPSGGGGAASPSPSSFSAPIGGGGGGGGGGLSPSAQGNSEGSGLIDIRSMGAMLGGGGGGGGGGGEDDRDDSMLPSFGGTGFGGLAAAPLLTAAPAAAPEPVVVEPQRQSQAPLYAIIAILVLGLGGLAAYVLTRPPPAPEKIVERVIQAAPVAAEKDDKDDDRKKKKNDEKDDKEEDGDDDAAADAADSAADPGDKKGVVKKTDKKGTTAVKTDVKKDAGTKTDTKTDEPKKVDTKPKEEDISVECLLDPSKCKKGGSGGGGGGGSKPPPDSSLPEKLELADIKAGTDGTKAAAKSNCASKAKGGEKVKIKLSISGPSGTVLSSTPEDDGGNAALGQCVAAELKKSTFKKVQKEQIGTVVSVTF